MPTFAGPIISPRVCNLFQYNRFKIASYNKREGQEIKNRKIVENCEPTFPAGFIILANSLFNNEKQLCVNHDELPQFFSHHLSLREKVKKFVHLDLSSRATDIRAKNPMRLKGSAHRYCDHKLLA